MLTKACRTHYPELGGCTLSLLCRKSHANECLQISSVVLLLDQLDFPFEIHNSSSSGHQCCKPFYSAVLVLLPSGWKTNSYLHFPEWILCSHQKVFLKSPLGGLYSILTQAQDRANIHSPPGTEQGMCLSPMRSIRWKRLVSDLGLWCSKSVWSVSCFFPWKKETFLFKLYLCYVIAKDVHEIFRISCK